MSRLNRAPLTLPGTLDSIPTIGAYVLEVAVAAGLEQVRSYRLRLAVEEIGTNTVVHGYQQVDREGTFVITGHSGDEGLTIIFEDDGPAYDPRQAPLPDDLDQPLDERPEGGLGIYLALMGVDEYDYQRSKDTNRHVFVQYLDK